MTKRVETTVTEDAKMRWKKRPMFPGMYREQAPYFEIAKRRLDEKRIEVVNLSSISLLECFRKTEWSQVFG